MLGPYAGIGSAAYYAGRRFKQYRRRRSTAGARANWGALKSGFKPRSSFRRVPRRFKKNLLAMTENKHIHNTAFNPGFTAGTSSITFINNIANGDGDGNRDGEDVVITSLQFKGTFSTPTTTIEDSIVKVMLVKHKDVRGTAMTITNLYESDSINAMRKITNSQNYTILKEIVKRIPVPQSPQADNHITNVQCNFYYKFKNPLRMKWSSTASGIANVDRNALYLVIMTNQASGVTATLAAQYRLTFKDV